ncbi:hypothetical protein [Bacillus solimangrovi]|uniref:Uncharacterized protein n=1 Tax=Bacillus solimangrovi TaxID=1305675 RepID=A0A1E5LJX3_9BACI|nr:hypothetical protein [Bacillus solimangrovi]OEH94387.1 hypothetical protein BFG57_07940 [Bacillus solimangrovi]
MYLKIFLKVISLVSLVLVGITFYYFYSTSVIKQLNNYTLEKYGEKVVLIDRGKVHTGNMGDTTHKVALKKEPEFVFDIRVDGNLFGRKFVVDEDSYEYAELSFAEYKKLEPYLDKISSLNLKRDKEYNYVSFKRSSVKDFFILNVSDTSSFDYKNLEEQNIARYFKLIEIIKKSGANISEVKIVVRNNYIYRLTIKRPNDINSEQQLYL